MMAGGFLLTKHGFPPGYRFAPTGLELISLLSDKIVGAKLRPPHDIIFHDLAILDYHPEELCENFRKDAEDHCIYFFSRRVFQKRGTRGGATIPGGKKERRPVRVARGGTWKASGGGKLLCWPRNKGGFVAGRVVTMVFYDHGVDKSNWGMHEFTVPVDKRLRLSSLPTPNSYKYIRFEDLALYRLYILRSGDMEIENAAGSSSLQMLANANDHLSAAPCPPVQSSWGIFAAGPSTTSQAPPPPQHPGVEHAHYYYHHQTTFAAASASAATYTQQQARNVPVHGAWLPGDSFQFASPPALVPMPPAAANPEAHQAPTTATHGAGREAGHFGATHSPCSPPAEQHTTATTEPAHAQFADCFKPVEEAAPPQMEDIVLTAENERTGMDEYHGPEMPDWDLSFATFDEHRFDFTMEEILGLGDPAFDEPPAMEGGSNSGGGGNYSQSQPAGGAQQKPPAPLGCY